MKKFVRIKLIAVASIFLLALGLSNKVLADKVLLSPSQNASMDTLQKKLLGLQSFTADFEQQVVDSAGELLQEAKGHIKLQQPQKLYWEVFPPNEGTLVADGSTLWHVDPFVEQVIAMDQSNAVNEHPIMLLAEPQSALWNDYNVRYKQGAYLIEPHSKQQSIKQLKLVFTQKNQLKEIELLDQQDQTNTLKFNNIKQNLVIPAGVFQFTVPNGFELDDQR